MKRIIALVLAAAISLLLSACGSDKVRYSAFNEAEKIIASAAGSVVVRFCFPPDTDYELTLWKYAENRLEEQGGMKGASSSPRGTTLVAVADGDFDSGFEWIFAGDDGALRMGPIPAGVKVTGSQSGVGQSEFRMEAGQEYLLCYIAAVEGTTFRTEWAAPFSHWNDVEDFQAALKPFSCVYFVTARLCEEPAGEGTI